MNYLFIIILALDAFGKFSVQFGKPSLVCNFQELYRYLIDDFLIGRFKKLNSWPYETVTGVYSLLKSIKYWEFPSYHFLIAKCKQLKLSSKKKQPETTA